MARLVEKTQDSIMKDYGNIEDLQQIPKDPILDKRMNDLSGKEWIRESISVWFQKGLGKNHEHASIERQHPAPFSYQDIVRFINFFTKEKEVVLDPFCGVASTLKACALTHRSGIGIELSAKWAKLGAKRLKTEVDCDVSVHRIIVGDALKILPKVPDNSIGYVVTSPPYWNILGKKPDHKTKQERIQNGYSTKYSKRKNDLGNIPKYDEFLDKLQFCFCNFHRILKPKHYVTIIVSDFRHKSEYYSFHSDVITRMKQEGFTLKGITILVQNQKSTFPYGYPYSYVPNIHHQYAVSFRRDR